MTSRFVTRIALVIVAAEALLFSAGSVVARNDADQQVVIHYFKDARPLTLNPRSIAVKLPPDVQLQSVERAISDRAVGGVRLESHAVETWHFAHSEESLRASDVRTLISDISARPDVEFASPVFVDDLGGPMFITRDILVGFRPEFDPVRAEEILKAFVPGEIRDRDYGNMKNVFRIASSSKDGFAVLAQANALITVPDVTFAEPDMMFTGRGALIPNDPAFPQCWGLRNTGQSGGTSDMDMDSELAWDITTGSSSIIVVVIDTGVDQTHPDIHQVTPGIDTTSENGDGGPLNSFDNHGTPVGGCVSARINNGLGTVGSAPGCRVASARTFISLNSGGGWSSSASWTVDSLTYAETIGARVTNNSNYYGFTSGAIATKYSTTRTNGIIHFASAGNDNHGPITYPANLPTVNSIASIDRTGNQSSFSNEGPQMDLAAPGRDIYTTDRQGAAGWSGSDYVIDATGTSFASPYAAGCAALVLSLNPSLSAIDVENILYSTAVDRGAVGFDNEYGWGIINAHQALLAVQPPSPPGDFNLLTPADDQGQVSQSPFFQWSNATGADEYRLIVDDSSDFSSPEIDLFTFLATHQVSGDPLAQATRYYWKVIASNETGMTTSTPSSFSFTTDGPLPQVFVLASPQPGTVVETLQPTFVWTESAGATNYVLEVDDESSFASPEINEDVAPGMGGVREFTPSTALQNNQDHWWRVTAHNVVGGTASIPASIQFSVQVPGGCAGDADGNQAVDVNDISYIIFRLGLIAPADQGADVDGSGSVTVNDISYTVFRLGTCN